ncbi:uncharacterized protein BCR38DRAFT_513509 [Pseudomassariella vexata]|uniref:Uncharacterized protein n=1 Tax=Pseudomassariella vexata TaxID=1141098 RepID=A0A1Y2E174_9PEZI|nr:uncharacterized protein BCR38DRAFT_513509 [Pseudomassariella vexata]ORY65094.1 hypothetical protein BCR38DRAFT_513509 [Pseudomassariella vexata]
MVGTIPRSRRKELLLRVKSRSSCSTLIGHSGLLVPNPASLAKLMTDWATTESSCEDRSFVLNPISQSIFELSQEPKHEFQPIVAFEHISTTMNRNVMNPDLRAEVRKFILREVGLVLKDLHAKHWIHLGRRLLDRIMGNVMWRRSEGQIGKKIGKPSEVFSFGLVVDLDQLRKEGAEPEQVILYKLLSSFGPLSDELVKHVNDEYGGEVLMTLSQVIADEGSSEHFDQWDETVYPNSTQGREQNG